MDAFLNSPEAMKELGFFWTFIALVVASRIYFGPDIKALIKGIPARRSKSDQMTENNTEALRSNKEDRDTTTAILIEHDRKSEIRFEHQNETLARIESKL
ncbi:hypothetical protein [Eggerthella lenta]|uniref:hypothetical protein n=1 Tax=Eggerthella lenta TaxID=84112 RepID=UPI001EDFF76C|nr:hypothetical protein [Eggerthella lenta]MCG4515346.1 hypothetical protein [Eggerthella lenta]